MTGINDGKFEIGRRQGISQAIAEEIGLTEEQCLKVDWRSVFEIVKEAKGKEGNIATWAGGDDLFGNGHQNYVVQKGQQFEFSSEIWTRIVDTVKNSLTSKNINIDNLNELMVADFPAPPEPYIDADRFLGVLIDETKTTRTDVANGKMATFYDTEGKKIKEVSLYNDDTTSETYYDTEGKVVYTLNRARNGAITHAEVFDREGNKLSWQDENGEVHRENGSNVEIKICDGKYDFADSFTISEYDNNGNKIKESDLYTSGEYMAREYGENGYIKKEMSCEIGSDYVYEEYLYDTNGKKSERIYYSTLGSDHVYINQKHKYEYNQNIQTTTVYDKNGNISFTFVEEYDRDGNITKSAYIRADGSYTSETIYEYQDGKLIKKIEPRFGHYTTYEYNEDGEKELLHRIDDDSVYLYRAWERDADGVWNRVDHDLRNNNEQ